MGKSPEETNQLQVRWYITLLRRFDRILFRFLINIAVVNISKLITVGGWTFELSFRLYTKESLLHGEYLSSFRERVNSDNFSLFFYFFICGFTVLI